MQPAPGPGASWGQWESTGGCGGRWIWAGGYNPWCFWEQKALHQCAEILLLFSISNHSHTEQEQRRALAPSLPLAEPSAQLDSSLGSLAPLLPVQLGGLSLTDCAPHGCYVGASPVSEHWAKAAGLECDCPSPSEGVCRQDQRTPSWKEPDQGTLASHCYKVLTVSSSGCETQAALARCFPKHPAAPWLGVGMGSAVPTVLLATARPPRETAGKGRG